MGKKQKCPEFENHERWLVSFADMMTLLFALFVVLFALKDGADSPEIEQAAAAAAESFNMNLEEIPVGRRIGPNEAGFGIFEQFDGDKVMPPMLKKFPRIKKEIKVLESDKKMVEKILEDRLYGDSRNTGAKKEGFSKVVSVHRSEEGLVMRLMASHFYGPGEYKVRKNTQKDLKVVADILKDIGRPVVVEGHTDSLPAAGGFSNWDISALRASHITRSLIKSYRFPKSLVSAGGYADTRPISSNSTKAGRSLNRRIELRIKYIDE